MNVTITYQNEKLRLSEKDAIELHSRLAQALAEVGLTPENHAALEPPAGVQSFTPDQKGHTLTDC